MKEKEEEEVKAERDGSELILGQRSYQDPLFPLFLYNAILYGTILYGTKLGLRSPRLSSNSHSFLFPIFQNFPYFLLEGNGTLRG